MSDENLPLLDPDSRKKRKDLTGTFDEVFSRPPGASTSPSAPVVYCVHGNKWGVAQCCQDLGEEHEELVHCHTDRQEGVDKKARNKLIFASILCLLFMTAEIVGGILSNSLAIATDAAHLLTDFASFMISLFAIWMSGKPRSERMSFGWHRAEVLGAIVSVLMIWVVTGILVYMAVLRVLTQEFEIDTTVMLITSGLGVLVNIIMGASLHQHGHSHGGADPEHGHAHGQGENINVKAAFIHVVGDFLQSLGVFVAAMIIYFKPGLAIVDPICTFIFSILVLATTINILRNTLAVIMEASPVGVSYSVVRNTFLAVPGIRAVHNLRIWSLTTDKTAMSAHLVVEQGLDEQKVLQKATLAIRQQYKLYEMTLQVETFQQGMNTCGQCKDETVR